MGDSVSQTSDESKKLAQSGGQDALTSQVGANANRNAGKGRQETLSQQNVPQTGYVQGHGQQYPSHYHPAQTRPDPYNLSQLTTALPDTSYQNYGQRFPSAPGSSGLGYPTQHSPQYAPQPMASSNAPYPYQTPFQGVYVAGNPPAVAGMGNQFYHQGYIRTQQQPYMMQPNQFPLHSPVFPGMQHPSQYGSRGSISEESRGAGQQRTGGEQGGSDSIGKPNSHNQLQWGFYRL